GVSSRGGSMHYGFDRRLPVFGVIVLLFAPPIAIGGARVEPRSRQHLHIGLSGQKFLDLSEERKKHAVDSMHDIVQVEIGYSNDIVIEKSSTHLAELLAAGKFDLAVFTGYELAVLKQERPDLRPLAIATCGDYHLRAHVLVRSDNPAKNFAGLAG